MAQGPHLAAEDYLADIYRLEAEGVNATTGAVAERRSVTPASATGMFKRLSRDGLVTYHEYEGVVLTEEGQRLALGVLRRHRLVERFLTDVLRLPWDQVDGIADQMEHALPDVVVDALEALLGNPFTCPHGYPIPDREGHVVESPALCTLGDLQAGDRAVVARVDERVPGLLAYLDGLGVVPGTMVRVTAVNPLDETVSLRTEATGGREHVVGPRIARAVSVTPSGPGADSGRDAPSPDDGEAGRERVHG
jgi:DtxR family Mn-dependent transcriptional regulator